MFKIWILTSEAPDDESIIDRSSLVSEGIPGGQYENIRLFDELKYAGFNVKIINPKRIEINNNLIMCNNQYINKPDIVVLRTIQGSNIEILRSLKKLGIKFINDLDAHLTCADKPKQLEILFKSNVDIPKTKIINLPFEHDIFDDIIFPVVVKPISSQRGELVKLCNTIDDVYIHCKAIRNRFSCQRKVIFQEYINGPSISVNTIDGSPICAQIRYPKENIDFLVSNRRDDAIRLPYSINDDLYNLICKATKALNIKIARIDILKLGNQYKICEVNSPGGFSGRDDYFVGTNHARDIAAYIMSIL